MTELERKFKGQNLKAIHYALVMLGLAIAVNVFPLAMALYEYTAEGYPKLTGNLGEKFNTLVEFLIDPAQKDKAIWLKIFLVTIPMGLLLMARGFADGPLGYLVPLAVSLAVATGLNHALVLLKWQMPGVFTDTGFFISMLGGLVVGLIALVIGSVLTIRNSVLLKTAFHLAAGTFFTVLITLLFPFILLGMAIFLKKKRGIRYTEFLSESGNFYNFLILNIFPICFQIIPSIRMVIQKGRQEAKQNKKKYRKTEEPRYEAKLDFDKLRVGDVILTGKSSWGNSAAIQASNLLSCGEDFRYWSHAVIYAGARPDEKDDPAAPRRNIIEAQSEGKGVQEIDLLTGEKVIYEKLENQEPVIKRFSEKERKEFNFDAGGNRKIYPDALQKTFTERDKQLFYEKSYFEEGYFLMVLRHKQITDPKKLQEVVEFCRKKSGLGYDTWGVSFYSLCALVPPMLSGWLEDTMAEKIFNVGDAYFCSELVADAFMSVGEKSFDRSPWRVKPLDFRTNPLFREVDCGYQRIPLNDSARAEVAAEIEDLRSKEKEARRYAEMAAEDRKKEWETMANKFAKAAQWVEKGTYPAYSAAD